MRSTPLRALSIACFLLSAAGCGPAVRAGGAASPQISAASLAQLDAIYVEAIRRSAVVAADDVLTLRPLVARPDGTVTVTTWASCRGAGSAGKCGTYVPGRVTLKWDAWVVADEEFASACRALRGDLDLKVSQLLGLPAPRTRLPDDNVERQFVTFSDVPVASIFRPCTDPRVDTDRCSTALPARLPGNAPPDFYRWFTNQAMSSWQIPGHGEAPAGYPWSRLGYTYNWDPAAKTRYGVSEYVIPGSLRPIEVTVAAVKTARDYCR